MNIDDARELLLTLTTGESLLRHARSVELVMEAYGEKLGEDKEKFAITGLLHDADYEAFPDQHPNVIVQKLRELDEEDIAYAISAHYTKWNVPCTSNLDKALLACDELTGFIVACTHVRPDGIDSLTPKSVVKKLKDKKFAAKGEREEVTAGIELLGVDRVEHIQFIIDVLKANKEELKLVPAD
jgi:predicted hydrolase (HD superfamily)